ncbi:MAG: AAA domain-containing protein [Armatimonadota bacterium]
MPPPPQPPPILRAWLDPERVANPNIDQLELLAEPIAVSSAAEHDPSRDQLEQALAAYLIQDWSPWAIVARRAEAVFQAYSTLFGIYQAQQRSPEEFELVLGLGYLTWRTPSGQTVKRHLLTIRAQLEFDPSSARLTLVSDLEDPTPKLEQDMIEVSERPAAAELAAVEDSLAEAGDTPWADEAIHTALRSWANAIPEARTYSEDFQRQLGEPAGLEVRFAPALILRKRDERSILRVFDDICAQLEDDSPEVTRSLASLVADAQDTSPAESQLGEPDIEFLDTPPARVLFPLPANEEQMEIARLAEHHEGVVVQGPPGTGKSRTIANLVSHLLAGGKRVLVTSHAARALEVLRGFLPREVQPLCVVAIGADPESKRSLEQSVQGICSKHSSWRPSEAEAEIARLEQILEEAHRATTLLQRQLLQIREGETESRQIGSYRGTLQHIADELRNQEAAFAWLTERPSPTDHPPLPDSEAAELLALLRRFPGGAGANLLEQAIDIEHLWTPQQFTNAVRAASALYSYLDNLSQAHQDPRWALLTSSLPEAMGELGTTLCEAHRTLIALQSGSSGWVQSVIKEVAAGRVHHLGALSRLTAEHLGPLMAGAPLADQTAISGLDRVPPVEARTAARNLLSHLQAGGNVGWWVVRPGIVRQSWRVLKNLRVNGQACNTAEALEPLLVHIDITERANLLRSEWADVVPLPDKSFQMLCEHLRAYHESLEQCLRLDEPMSRAKTALCSIDRLPAPDWTDADELAHLRDLCGFATKHAELRKLDDALNAFAAFLKDKRTQAPPDAPVHALASSVVDRDPAAYGFAYERLTQLLAALRECERRDDLLEHLRLHAPVLAHDLSLTPTDPVWDGRLNRLSAAWEWARADEWLRAVGTVHEEGMLRCSLEEAERTLAQSTTELAAGLAWRHCLSRLTEFEARELRAWQNAVRKIGKGTGKSAPLHRREARGHMENCSSAIPAWIMPIYRVAETFSVRPGAFDVVIVDEASQAGSEALFLNYLGKTVIVVGDDQQIRPDNIGVPRDTVEELRRRFIADLPHKDSIGADDSFFDLAGIVYSRRLQLREHFRCMPEIIQFSNDLCYANTPLIPLKQYGSGRLTPTVAAIPVPYGRQEGTAPNVVNKPEAEHLVDHLVACCANPDYEGKTMGVISLLGSTHAKHIEALIARRISPEEIRKRDIQCGDAYAFQGNERDVIFLSLVCARTDRQIMALTKSSDIRRFNVAASRAKEQMLLFHTATTQDLSSHRDCVRRKLLEYCEHPTRASTPLPDGLDLAKLRTLSLKPESGSRAPKPFDSWFEVQVYCAVALRGYQVIPQHRVGNYKIDLLIVGMAGRMAVECDGDEWHGLEQYEQDMARQRQLERAGYPFWRVRGSEFYRDPEAAMQSLWQELTKQGILPGAVC